MNDNTQQTNLLTRDAHLSELTVNRFLAGELDDEETAVVEQHVVGCSNCNARVESVRAFDAGFALAPPAADRSAPERGVVSLAERRPSSNNWIVAVLAAAAAIALVFVARGQPSGPVTPDEVDDGIRLKGSGLALDVFAKSDDAKPRRVGQGDVVHPGDRLGFQITSRQAGYIMVVGIDDAGQVYGGWPQGAAPSAEFMDAQDGPRDLEVAVELDDVGSKETLVLMRCPQGFDLAAASKQLKSRTSLESKAPRDPMSGCVYDEVPLKKQPR